MMMDISIMVAVIGCFVGLAGWIAGRDKKITNDSEWRGEVNAKLDALLGIRDDVKALGGKVDDHEHRLTAVEESAKQAHHRVTDHINIGK